MYFKILFETMNTMDCHTCSAMWITNHHHQIISHYTLLH